MYNASNSDFKRRSWMWQRIRGWRFEASLMIGTWAALRFAQISLGLWGPDIVGLTAAIILMCCPTLRAEIMHRMLRNRREIQLQGSLWMCDIVGRSGSLPTVRDSRKLPVGIVYLVELPTGLHLESIERKLPELAVAMNARAVRAKASRGTARFVELTVIRGDAFKRPIASPLLKVSRTSLWDPVTLGVGEDGGVITVELPEHNLLIGGEPGSGKSVAMSSIVGAAALDPHVNLILIDGKEVELSAWRDVADQFVGASQDEANHVLEDVRGMMNDRYKTLAMTRRRKIQRDDVDGLVLVVIDELALFLRGGDKANRDLFAELLRDLIARGRAAGIIVVAATQKPSHETVPTYIRDLFSYRLAMRCSSRDASDTILGQGWASQGYSAASIDPSQRGVGLLLAEGGIPIEFLVVNIDDHDLSQIVTAATEVRTYGP
jgi:phosphoglycolate phosphatase-like HAD superfamily hydrolase